MPVHTPSPRPLAMLGSLAPWLASARALPQGTAPAPVQQKVTGPLARYRVSAETASGLAMAAMQGGGGGGAGGGGGGMGGLSAMMSAMLGW